MVIHHVQMSTFFTKVNPKTKTKYTGYCFVFMNWKSVFVYSNESTTSVHIELNQKKLCWSKNPLILFLISTVFIKQIQDINHVHCDWFIQFILHFCNPWISRCGFTNLIVYHCPPPLTNILILIGLFLMIPLK